MSIKIRKGSIFLDRNGSRKEAKPLQVTIRTMRNICNLNCPWCANYSLKTKAVMSLKLLGKILEDLHGWLGQDPIRVDLTPQGELLLRSDAEEIIRKVREALPKSYIYLHTNGELWDWEKAVGLLEVGLNQLLVDKYFEKNKMVDSILENLDKIPKDIKVYKYISDKNTCFNLRTKKEEKVGIYLRGSVKTKRIIIIDNFVNLKHNRKNIIRKFNTWLFYPNPKLIPKLYHSKTDAICLYPSRQIVISEEGLVLGCCLSAGNDIIFGKFPEDGLLKEIWTNEFANVFRYILRYGYLGKKRFWFRGCRRCGAVESRSFPATVKLVNPFINKPTKDELEKFIRDYENRYNKYRDPAFFEKERWWNENFYSKSSKSR